MHLTLAAKGVFWFTLWTGFSFLAHLYARNTIRAGDKSSHFDEWIIVSLLTLAQLLVGGIVLHLSLLLGDKGWIPGWNDAHVEKKSMNGGIQEPEQVKPCRISLYLSHVTATMATNASIAFVNTGSAFTIKAFEPISTAVLTSMLLGNKLQTHVIIALPLVVSGALGFVWQPSLKSGATFGLGMAFVSNILFGVRNINLKLFQKDGGSMRLKLDLLRRMSFMSAGINLLISGALMAGSMTIPCQFNYFTALTSGLFHITYTIISTCVILTYTSVVGHATCNLLKRILVAAFFFLIGQTVITSSNWLMGGVMLFGLAIYVFPSKLHLKDINPSLSLIVVISGVVLLVAFMSPLLGADRLSLLTSSSDSSECGSHAFPKLDLSNTLLQRSNELSVNAKDGIKMAKVVDVIREPTNANSMSIQAEDTNSLIQEAYRLHQLVFTHILGKYKKAILVNVFQWSNKGDHLITIGQRKILERMGIKLVYHCYYPGRDCDFTRYVNKQDDDLVILIQGAGYIGHPSHELVVSKALENFPNNRIMVFPISVCHPVVPCTEIQQFNEIFKKHKDVHIVLRDRYSYDLSEQYFKTTHNYMAPDSAFAVGSIRLNIVPIYDIIWLKRDDWESQKDAMPEMPSHLKVQVTDWDDDWMKQTSDNFWEEHQLRTMTGISFLARGKVIISDRLHAHIMSQLMGKLNVVINSETKKQEHYYMTWEQSITTSTLVNNNKEALEQALKLLERYDESVTLV